MDNLQMTKQEIAQAGVKLIPELFDKNYITKPFFGPADKLDTVILALNLLKGVAEGTHVIVPKEPPKSMRGYILDVQRYHAMIAAAQEDTEHGQPVSKGET